MPITPGRLVKANLIRTRLVPVGLAGIDFNLAAGLALPFNWNFLNGLGPFSGANLSIVGGKLAITPTLGAEMWDGPASVFTAGTYAWAPYGANTIANVANALNITYVNHASGAQEFLNDAADLSANLTIGQWYRFSVKQSINLGASNIRIFIPVIITVMDGITTTPTLRIAEILALNATTCYLRLQDLSAGEVVTLDDLSLKPMILASMIAGGLSPSKSNVIVKAAWTLLTLGSVIGVTACLDNYSNPQNGLFGYHDGIWATLNKLVNGTWTNLINATAIYVAGANVEIDTRYLPAVTLRYNDVQIGTTQTVTDPSIIYNKLHIPFAGDPDSRCSSFSITN